MSDKRLLDERLHPELRARVTRVLAEMRRLGHPMRVTDGYRTAAEQARLYAKGRTVPPLGKGYRVTNVDGVRTMSHHQTGRAIDCAFVTEDGGLSWDGRLPWARYGALAVAEGLIWGGHFKSLVDRPHVELPVTIP
jgi:peptidoglycan L-alanyl-D-glutamate endopeptidase CwlK